MYEEWDMYRTALFRTSWEQARFMAHCALMPHTKRGFRPTELVRFDWDTENAPSVEAATKMDFERIRDRFEEC